MSASVSVSNHAVSSLSLWQFLAVGSLGVGAVRQSFVLELGARTKPPDPGAV